MSEHEVKVIKIDNIQTHENADSLEIINIWGYACIVRKGQFKIGDLAAFIEPDYCVDIARPEFSFIQSSKQNYRITIRRFRGVYSYGLLIAAPFGTSEGDNVMELLGVTRWEPQTSSTATTNLRSGESIKGPEFPIPKYDLENIRKYNKLITADDNVYYTIKLHGTNMRACFHNGKMYCGSRNTWKNAKALGMYFTTPKSIILKLLVSGLSLVFGQAEKAGRFLDLMAINFLFFGLPYRLINTIKTKTIYEHTKKNAWQSALEQNPWIETWCRENPDVVVYGELIGPTIQGAKFHYGYVGEQLGFYVFDILENGQWISNSQFEEQRFSGLKFVPVVYQGPFDQQKMESLAEEIETFNNANHIREGLVIKLQKERINSRIGRVALKYVSNAYFEKS
jgi:RNA ligase (TIGR02306 family)